MIYLDKGNRIRELRESKGYSQEELAKLLCTTKQTVSKYEKNIVTNIPSDRIERLSEILGTTPSYILWGFERDPSILKDIPPYDSKIIEVIDLFCKLTDKQKDSFLDLLRNITNE